MIGKTVAATVAAAVLMVGGASIASAVGGNYHGNFFDRGDESSARIEIRNEDTNVGVDAKAYANSGENEQEIEVSLADSRSRFSRHSFWGYQGGQAGDPYQGMMTGEAVATTNLSTHVNGAEVRMNLGDWGRRGDSELNVDIHNDDTDVDIDAEAKAESGENEQEIELRQRSRHSAPVIAQEMATGRADSLVSASTFVNMLNLRISR